MTSLHAAARTTDPDGRDTPGKAGLVIGFNIDAAKGGFAFRRLRLLARHLCHKATQ